MALFTRGDHVLLDAVRRAQGVVELSITGAVSNANARYLNVLGYTLDELRGRSLEAVLHPLESDTSASPRAGGNSGCRRSTIQSATARVNPTRS